MQQPEIIMMGLGYNGLTTAAVVARNQTCLLGVDILRPFKIDIHIIGDEYANKSFTGRVFCEKKGIELYFNKREHRFSSSGLRREVHEKEGLRNK